MNIQNCNSTNFQAKLVFNEGMNSHSKKLQNIAKKFEEKTQGNELELIVNKKQDGIVHLIAGVPFKLRYIFCELSKNISNNLERLPEDLIVNKFAKFTTEAKHEIGWTDWIKSTIKKSIDEEKPTRQIIQESLVDDGEKIQKNPIINKFLNNMGEFNPNAAPEVREEFFGKDNFFKDATLYLK